MKETCAVTCNVFLIMYLYLMFLSLVIIKFCTHCCEFILERNKLTLINVDVNVLLVLLLLRPCYVKKMLCLQADPKIGRT